MKPKNKVENNFADKAGNVVLYDIFVCVYVFIFIYILYWAISITG